MRRALLLVWMGLALLTVGVLLTAPPSVGIGVQTAEMCAYVGMLPSYDPLFKADGRINQVAHFGGDALYCVNSADNPTNDLSVMLDDGAFRVLDQYGQPLWTVPAAQIAAAIAQAKTTGQGVEVGAGQGTYGPVSLWVIDSDDDGPIFQFNGLDEHGKANSLEFNACEPVNPIPSPGDHSGSASTLCTINFCGPWETISCSDILCTAKERDTEDFNHNGRTDDYLCFDN